MYWWNIRKQLNLPARSQAQGFDSHTRTMQARLDKVSQGFGAHTRTLQARHVFDAHTRTRQARLHIVKFREIFAAKRILPHTRSFASAQVLK